MRKLISPGTFSTGNSMCAGLVAMLIAGRVADAVYFAMQMLLRVGALVAGDFANWTRRVHDDSGEIHESV